MKYVTPDDGTKKKVYVTGRFEICVCNKEFWESIECIRLKHVLIPVLGFWVLIGFYPSKNVWIFSDSRDCRKIHTFTNPVTESDVMTYLKAEERKNQLVEHLR